MGGDVVDYVWYSVAPRRAARCVYGPSVPAHSLVYVVDEVEPLPRVSSLADSSPSWSLEAADTRLHKEGRYFLRSNAIVKMTLSPRAGQLIGCFD